MQELNGARVARHAATGQVRFISAPPGNPIRSAGGGSPERAARGFLSRYGKLFGVRDQLSELRAMRTERVDRGRSSVHFQQTHKGIPVLAGELVVNLDAAGNVLSANGETTPRGVASSTPRVTVGIAKQVALGTVAKAYKVRARSLSVSKPRLWIYDNRLLGGPGLGHAVLVWRMDVSGGDLGEVRELVLVDAQKGTIALHFNQVAHAKTRYVCDRGGVVNANDQCLSSTDGYTRVEGQAATGKADVDRAYDYAGLTYDYFKSRFGRDSLDNKGMALRSTVRYCPDSDNCPYLNAYWNGKQMVYGTGFSLADDVVGHELSHGVTDHSSHLFYYYQAGAINESLSDVFGEFIDQTYNVTTDDDTTAVRWQLGEDLPDGWCPVSGCTYPNGALRDMKNPPALGQPDRMGSPYYYSGVEDQGGVHTNSGVGNKAAYLMVDGGSFNGRTVTALGLAKTGRIFYEVEANLLTSGSDYSDLYWALRQACSQLVGTAGITSANCVEVNDALLAVQMNGQPTGVTHPEAPFCAAGQIPTDLFSDNLENTASGNWAKSRAVGSSNWAYPSHINDYPAGEFDGRYSTSGINNFWGENPDAVADFSIALTRNIVPPVGKTTYVRFDHAYSFEEYQGSYYDGGVVEYSVNGGAWTDAGPLFSSSGYRGTIQSGDGNPLGGRQGFVGRSNGYLSSRLTLPSTAQGKNVRIRFRIGADSLYGDYGWFVDDIRSYTCATGTRPAPSTTNRLRNPGFEFDDDNNSLPDGWAADQSALRMPTVKRSGQYALRHKMVDNQVYTVSQVATGLTAGKTYTFTGYVNIPTTRAAVSFSLDWQFRNSAGTVIGTVPIKNYTAHTSGAWNLASKSAVAPTGTTSARVRMTQRGVASTVYTDDFLFKP